jgi:hypothetical protein
VALHHGCMSQELKFTAEVVVMYEAWAELHLLCRLYINVVWSSGLIVQCILLLCTRGLEECEGRMGQSELGTGKCLPSGQCYT